MPYVSADTSLPRTLDVTISMSTFQTEERTDLSILCLACENLGLLPDANRVRFYSSIEAVELDYDSGSEAHFGATAFFSQSPRAKTMAIGEVFTSDLPGMLVAAALTDADITAIELITDGSMDIVYDIGGSGTETVNLTGLDFSGVTTVEEIAAVIDSEFGSDADLVCEVKTLPDGEQLITISTVLTGDDLSVSFPTDPETGTFIGTVLNLTEAAGGTELAGHTYVDIADELSSIQNAAATVDKFIYGWCLGASLRVVAIQEVAAVWALARTAMMPLVSNDPLALSVSFTEDLGTVVAATSNKRAPCIYHDNAQSYPDVSILAYMLHVNYRSKDSTVTAKFKQLPGIETVQLTETQWTTLQSKGYNTYTAIGVSSQTYRDGTTQDTSLYMDTVINLDNFEEDLSVNVYNVFLRNKKIPYTRLGQLLLVDACKDTGDQYTFNGTFAAREIEDTTVKSGTSITPAVQVIPTSISQSSASDRTARIAPPIQMIVQEAGAMHEIAINVEVVS